MVNPGGGVTPLFGPHRDVQLNRPRCPKQGVEFWLAAVLNRVWYKEPRTFNPDCEQYLSFQSQKNLGWKGKRSCGAFFFSDLHNINWIKPTVTRTLQCHQSTSIIFWARVLLLPLSFNLNYIFHLSVLVLTEQIVPVGLVSLSWITWWKRCPCVAQVSLCVRVHPSGIYLYRSAIFFSAF